MTSCCLAKFLPMCAGMPVLWYDHFHSLSCRPFPPYITHNNQSVGKQNLMYACFHLTTGVIASVSLHSREEARIVYTYHVSRLIEFQIFNLL